MNELSLKALREHCDKQCVRYGTNKYSEYYKEHYLVRKLLDSIDCNLEKHDAKVRADAIDEVIALARAEIDFESQAEQKRFVEFMEQIKEQNNEDK